MAVIFSTETFDKSPKKKKKAKPPKKKQKVKKKKKKAKNSGDEEDEYCDNMLANISYKKGSSLLGYNATNGENSQGTSCECLHLSCVMACVCMFMYYMWLFCGHVGQKSRDLSSGCSNENFSTLK